MSEESKSIEHPRKLIDHLELFSHQIGDNLKWPLKGIESGFQVIDELTDSFKPGLYIFAGGTGAGKSSFLNNLMYGFLSKNQQSCGIHFSYDVNYLEQVGKYLALASNLPLNLIKNPKKLEEEDIENRF
ncbi:DnaB helicase C-terminal domain-containing protein, partial [bacterium]|nr:DnaB helicase C-terminal domain-containing protein [bacterium]